MNQAWETLGEQYRTGANLDVRIGLHERFSTNPRPWPLWVFDQFALPLGARVLEVGCGTAELWRANRPRVPAGWVVTLSDRSAGMVRQARRTVGQDGGSFRFAVCDAQRLPFPDARFDAVVANHMLYHVRDLPTALREIRRVLRPAGRLYAAANGAAHMREIDGLVPAGMPHLPVGAAVAGFTLENGRAALERCFAAVEVRRRNDALVVTEAAPLAAYCLSRPTTFAWRAQISEAQKEAFLQRIEATLRAGGGAIRITKDAGTFIASGMALEARGAGERSGGAE